MCLFAFLPRFRYEGSYHSQICLLNMKLQTLSQLSIMTRNSQLVIFTLKLLEALSKEDNGMVDGFYYLWTEMCQLSLVSCHYAKLSYVAAGNNFMFNTQMSESGIDLVSKKVNKSIIFPKCV